MTNKFSRAVLAGLLAMLTACEEKPKDSSTWDDYAKRQQASSQQPGSTGVSTPAVRKSCADAAAESPNGRVSCTLSDGREFEGQLRDGTANGPGRMSFPEGARYDGTFADGLFNGRGTYYYPSGSRYDGEFHTGLRSGQGRTVYPNGSSYEGTYRNNKPNGFGTVSTASGVHSGIWTDGCLATARIAIDATLAECGIQ